MSEVELPEFQEEKKGLPTWAIVVLVIFAILILCCIGFFLFQVLVIGGLTAIAPEIEDTMMEISTQIMATP